MIADRVMQVSLQPRLIAISLENDSTTLAHVRVDAALTVNLLKQEDNGMAPAAQFVQRHNASKVRGREGEAASGAHDKLAGVDDHTTDRGCPILEDALAWLECEAQDVVPAGDRTLVIARVFDGAVLGSGDPLTSTFTGWSYSG
jgi:flavin reductase (DIM6/NTAB) family NADH-FMN oxidoreductase RutF